jgi:predicted membrane-bound spermidine synthase
VAITRLPRLFPGEVIVSDLGLHAEPMLAAQRPVIGSQKASSSGWLKTVFCATGFAANLYQIVWQRVLFTAFGVNVQAVTVVVTAFLAGLGVGSLFGGRLSVGSDLKLLRTFGLLEISVGAFGVFSIAFFRWVGEATALLPSTWRGLVVATIAMAPTTIMGMTLPILVAYHVRRTGNVGESVGTLYFVNTAGSALAAFAAALALMPLLGELRTTLVAALVNVLVGSSALMHAARLPKVA